MLYAKSDCFRCRCGCNSLPSDEGVSPALVDVLNMAGIMDDEINSAYRCPEHNSSVGGVPSSQHVEGTAADVDASRYGVDGLAKLFTQLGADGVGKYYNSNFVHVDVRYGGNGGGCVWDDQ